MQAISYPHDTQVPYYQVHRQTRKHILILDPIQDHLIPVYFSGPLRLLGPNIEFTGQIARILQFQETRIIVAVEHYTGTQEVAVGIPYSILAMFKCLDAWIVWNIAHRRGMLKPNNDIVELPKNMLQAGDARLMDDFLLIYKGHGWKN